jgi:hypothetical protein
MASVACTPPGSVGSLASPGDTENDEAQIAEQSASAASAASDGLTAEQAAMLAAVDASIADLDATIAALADKVDQIEVENERTLREIESLVARIDARRREVEEEYERKRDLGLFACMFGYCDVGAVSLAMAIADDARLDQLERELAAAERKRSDAQTKHDAYRARRERSEVLRDVLVDRATYLRQVFRGDVTPPGRGSTTFASHPELPMFAQRWSGGRALVDNLHEQIENLVELMRDARELAALLDRTLRATRAALEKADALREQSGKDFYDLLRIMSSGDPNAAAERWLDKALADKTKAVMKELGWTGWDPSVFVKRLLAKSFPGAEGSPAATELATKLVDALDF